MNPAANQSIVLLDDERPYAELMAQMLELNLSCSVSMFTRPREALTALPSLRPAVVVTDYFMPEVNGIDFIRQATPLVPSACFVLITGHNLADVQEQLGRLAVLRSILSKPFGWRALADEVLRVWPPHTPRPALRPAE